MTLSGFIRAAARRAATLTLVILTASSGNFAVAGGGQLKLSIVDQTGAPVACRMHLKNAAGKPRFAKGAIAWDDHFVFPGDLTLRLPRGTYSFEIERGPEYVNSKGHFTIEDHADDEKTVTLKRAVNMAAEGWWSSDLNVHRPQRNMKLLMDADDLHVAAVVAQDSGSGLPEAPQTKSEPADDENQRLLYLLATQDRRGGNDFLYLQSNNAVDAQFPGVNGRSSALDLLVKKKPTTWLDVATPFSSDLPIALALGAVNSVELANDHICRVRVINDEGEGRKRDTKKLRPPLGNALWSQQIYYHLLNCGLQIPPTAGSGSGVSPNPVGYNRVYVYTGDQLNEEAWWQALRAGRVLVTNGPLLRPSVRGQLPGHLFEAPAGEELSLDVSLSLTTRDPVGYLEIVKNGNVERAVRLDEWAKSGTLAPLVFKESGWFVIRAVTELEDTYRFASTGPYYVQIGDKPHVSRTSAQFFLDWAIDRSDEVKSTSKPAATRYCDQAVEFWQNLVRQANAP